jgi:hypothetical protein
VPYVFPAAPLLRGWGAHPAITPPPAARPPHLERSLLKTATPPHAHTRSLRRTVPGLGALLSLVLRDALQASGRFPRVQAFGSSGRLVKCTQASAGKRSGTSGPTSGHASLPWAFSDAAVLCRRTNPADQQYRTTRQKTPGPGNA